MYGTTTSGELLPGQYYDQETGLHYNYHRYYDPSTGRYITSDPIGLLGGLNTYGYVGGNPLTQVDPYGLSYGRAAGVGARGGAALGTLVKPGLGTAVGAGLGALAGVGLYAAGVDMMDGDDAPPLPGWEPYGDEAHPTGDEVDAACQPTMDCALLAYNIDVVRRDLWFRRWDMQRPRHRGGNKGHIDKYYSRQKDLKTLIEMAKGRCPYDPRANMELTKPHNFPTPTPAPPF